MESKVTDRDEIDWSNPELSRWMGRIRNENTKRIYKIHYKRFHKFTGKSPTELIDEADEDRLKPAREREFIPRQLLLDFRKWLVEDEGLASTTAHTALGSIRGFYSTFGIQVRFKGVSALPEPKVENRRMKVDAEKVRLLVENARTLRDKAIIFTMFQSGMDVSTLCSLKYEHVKEGLLTGDTPLKLDLTRPKTNVKYYTFLGRDSLRAISTYVTDEKARGFEYKSNDSLFLTRSGKPISPHIVQRMMKDVAERTGLVDENMNGKKRNPLSPHSLREGFSSVLARLRVNDAYIEFFLGHKISGMSKAYKMFNEEELREAYTRCEREGLSISFSSDRLQNQEKMIGEHQELIVSIVSRNEKLQSRVDDLQRTMDNFEKFIEKYLADIGDDIEFRAGNGRGSSLMEEIVGGE